MTVLLDTHALLWFVLRDPKLSSTARELIGDPATKVLVSPASYWEIAIKIGQGRYSLGLPYDMFMDRAIGGNRFAVLPIEPRHTSILTTLPRHHGDPFDRLLIAQAIVERIPLLSVDERFDAYPIKRIWSG